LTGAGRLAWVRQHLFEVVPVEVLERETERPLPELKTIPALRIEPLTSARPGTWRELVPKSQWRAVERFLAREDRGYVAAVEGNYAGRIWVSRTSHRDPWSGLRIRLAPDEAYTYAMQVAPPYRQLGVAAALVARMLADVRDEGGVSRIYGWVDVRNRESLVLLRVVFGFRPVQTAKRAHLVRRIGWQVRGSEQPHFGPLSQIGRHSGQEQT
jgi:GNAT superfamily N-acetyltransferase